jgi:hypothetical protein
MTKKSKNRITNLLYITDHGETWGWRIVLQDLEDFFFFFCVLIGIFLYKRQIKLKILLTIPVLQNLILAHKNNHFKPLHKKLSYKKEPYK